MQQSDKQYTVDRREGDVWVLTDGEGKRHLEKDLPQTTREGDHVVYTCTGAQLIPATEQEREEIRARMNSLFKKRR
ncbi:MAG: DUF3006 domain-containing protein [Clostridia bacterium]|nr:DUF3006 domain-containing protein [Clostridia bacterium]MBR4954788.1 DUF3006 domain-containing protein [Clostridia bacterium]MBR5903859.1 DUF3006 domain-containing protein [Clostridia bacterium]